MIKVVLSSRCSKRCIYIFKKRTKVLAILRDLRLEPDRVLTLVNGRMVTEDEIVAEGSTVEIMLVYSDEVQ